jgi:CheY-like chemotaxis protein
MTNLATFRIQRFPLILTDAWMPEMDGFRLVEHLQHDPELAGTAVRAREQSLTTHLPIIALTAHALKGHKERYLAVRMDGYVANRCTPRTSSRRLSVSVRSLEQPTAARLWARGRAEGDRHRPGAAAYSRGGRPRPARHR